MAGKLVRETSTRREIWKKRLEPHGWAALWTALIFGFWVAAEPMPLVSNCGGVRKKVTQVDLVSRAKRLRTSCLENGLGNALIGVTKKMFKDAWGTPMVVRVKKEEECRFALWSAGEDRKFGTEDDMRSWAK